MRFLSSLFIALFLVLPVFAEGDPTWNFDETDPEMNAAITEAKQTLPLFLKNAMSDWHLPRNALVKVSFPVETPAMDNEIIWVGDARQTGPESFIGYLANTPKHIPGASQGSEVRFSIDQIEDWSWSDASGRLYGNYSARAMLPYVDLATRRSLEGALSPNPIPSSWR